MNNFNIFTNPAAFKPSNIQPDDPGTSLPYFVKKVSGISNWSPTW